MSNIRIILHENVFTHVIIEGFNKQFSTNVRGNYFLCKVFFEMKMSERKPSDANLLPMSSEAVDQAYDIPYGMTKAAVNSFTHVLSRRVHKEGIRVNAIAPGVR